MASPLTLDSTVRIPEDVLFQELHGDGVLLNLKTGMYLGLDSVGRRVFQLLQAHGSLRTVLEKMLDEYDVSEAQCGSDLLALVKDMETNGIVTIA